MAEALLMAGETWLPWYRARIDAGQAIAPDRAAEMVYTLTSGQVDRLSGAFLSSTDDLTMLLHHSNDIEQGQMYKLRLRPLP